MMSGSSNQKMDSIELRSNNIGELSAAERATSTILISSPDPNLSLPVLKLLSAGFSFFVAGANDGSIGALIPYMLVSYDIRTSLISVLYASPRYEHSKNRRC
jgi:hypothetical protein